MSTNRAVTQEAAVVPVAKPQRKESIGHFHSVACISWQLSMRDSSLKEAVGYPLVCSSMTNFMLNPPTNSSNDHFSF